MLDYFRFYYLEMNFGPGYIATHIVYVAAMVLLLNEIQWTTCGLFRKTGEIILWWGVKTVLSSLCYWLLPIGGADDIVMVAILVLYAAMRSRYKHITRVVRGSVYFSCTMLAIPISEPIGDLFENLNANYTWAEHLTSVVMALACLLIVAFLRRFSTEMLTFIPISPAVLVVTASALGVLVQNINRLFETGRAVSVTIAACFWVLELMSYYMFYIVSKEYERNLELVAMLHREELDEELLEFSRGSYEEMHQIRHEVKNHLAYIRAMASNGEYEKLQEYLGVVSGETEELFQFVECGNEVVNAVMNHAIKAARSKGVEIKHQLVVPPELPYRETDLCSLLSNLTNNAIEAAVDAGQEKPVVFVSIRPQQDYLFLRVTNPVSGSIPPVRRLTLHTTKADERAHGYGTKIIRRIAGEYQGSVKFDIKDGQFIADVMLYLEEK